MCINARWLKNGSVSQKSFSLNSNHSHNFHSILRKKFYLTHTPFHLLHQLNIIGHILHRSFVCRADSQYMLRQKGREVIIIFHLPSSKQMYANISLAHILILMPIKIQGWPNGRLLPLRFLANLNGDEHKLGNPNAASSETIYRNSGPSKRQEQPKQADKSAATWPLASKAKRSPI